MSENKILPLVSVVMCTYNTERYIAEAIESVLSQTMQDFEFIIWDDGSTDRTKEIVLSYKDERIRYFYHENTGLGMALRMACAEARGEYIARMDSDDVCLSGRLAKEMAFLDKNQDYVLVSSAVYNINEEGDVLGRVFPCSDDKILKGVLRMPNSMISHPMSMMRRDAYEKAGGYLPIRKSQDMLFWSRLAKYGKFYNISEPLGKYRMLYSSLDHAFNPYKSVITDFLRKMIMDEEVLDADVEMFNELFQYSKLYINKTKSVSSKYKVSMEERFFLLLKPVVGIRDAEKIIVGIKNCYYRMKLCNLPA